MTATLTAPPQRQARRVEKLRTLLATFEVGGLQTYEREPGSDEWDEVVGRLATSISVVTGTDSPIYFVKPSSFAVSCDVSPEREHEIERAVAAVLDADPAGVELVRSTLAGPVSNPSSFWQSLCRDVARSRSSASHEILAKLRRPQ